MFYFQRKTGALSSSCFPAPLGQEYVDSSSNRKSQPAQTTGGPSSTQGLSLAQRAMYSYHWTTFYCLIVFLTIFSFEFLQDTVSAVVLLMLVCLSRWCGCVAPEFSDVS